MYRTTTAWMPGLTKTFRNGSRKLWDEFGGNMQNQPDELRRIYIFDEGKHGVQRDQSGAEALIVAHECVPGNYRSLFECGIKVHSWLALHLFRGYWHNNTPHNIPHLCSLPIPDLAKDPNWKMLARIIADSDGWEAKKRFYFIAKMVVHASSYGMRGPTFQLNVLQKSRGSVSLTRVEAELFLEMFHNLFPEIRIWHNVIREQLLATRTLRNLFGYPRLFTGALDDKLWKEAYAYIPQSTVGCITNIAWVKLQEYIEDNGLDWDLLNNCHDSYLCQVPVAEVAHAVKVMKDLIEQDLVSSRGDHYRMKSEATVGTGNWGKFNDDCLHCNEKKDKCKCNNYEGINPEGMNKYKEAA